VKKILLLLTFVGCASLTRGDDQGPTPVDAGTVVMTPDAGHVSVPSDAAVVTPSPDAGQVCTPQCDCDDDCSHGQACRSGHCVKRCDCDDDCGQHDCDDGVCKS